ATSGAGGSTGNSLEGGAGAGGTAGFGGGTGSDGDGLYGGGGSGYGGAVFVRNGGNLTITGNALFRENTVLAGSSNNGGASGQAAGSDIFMMKGANVLLAPGSGNTVRIEGQIADDSNASIGSGSYAPGSGADLRVGGGGLVQLAGQNTYSGKTIIEGATLQTALGQGIHATSTVQFNGTGTIGTLAAHANAGVLLLEQEVNLRAGSVVPGQIMWTGAGGFAAGSTAGLTIDLGKTTGGPSQTLQWGSSYLTSGSTLVFGSEYGLGSVHFKNDINLAGLTGNVAVFDSQQLVDGQKVNDVAVMSGKLTNGSLRVGSAGYDGTLYLTGQNALTSLEVNSGLVSSLSVDATHSGTLMRSAGGNVTVNGGTLVMGGTERIGHLNVAAQGNLIAAGEITTGAVDNVGRMSYLGTSNVATLTNRSGATFNVAGATTASGAIVNDAGGTINQIADMQAVSVTNNGEWNVDGDRKIATATLGGHGEFATSQEATRLTIDQSANSTFDGTFSGAGSLAKAGAGTLVLTGASTHTGGTTVRAGTLDTTGGGTLADTGAVTIEAGATFRAGTADTVGAVANSGTLEVNAAQTVASLANHAGGTTQLNAGLASDGTVANHEGATLNQSADIAAAVVGNSGTLNVAGQRGIATQGLVGDASGRIVVAHAADKLVLDQSANSVYAGQIDGQGSFEKTGAGILNLTGANGFTGGLAINGGTVDTTGGGTLDDHLSVSIASGAGFVAGSADTIGAVANSGTLTVNAAQTVASLDNAAGATAHLNAKLSSNGAVANAQGGTVNMAGEIVAASAVTNEGTIHVGGNSLIDSAGFQGAGDIALASGAALTVQQSADSTYAGVIAGDGTLAKTGTGTLTLAGQNTHTGGTVVRAGTVDTTGGGTLADTGAVVVEAGATFRAGTADTVGAVANSGTLEINAAQTVASLANADGGVAQLNANLTSAGTVANFAGGTVHQSADIQAATVGNSGTLNVLGQRAITTQGLAGDASGRIVLAGAADKLVLNQSGNSAYAGQINGQGSFEKTGAGTLVLSGANGATGALAVKAGAVEVTGSLANSAVDVARGAGLAVAANALAASSTLANAGTVEVRGDNTVGALVNSGTLGGTGKLTAATYALNDGSVVNANLGAGTLTTQGVVLLNGTSDAAVVNVLGDSVLTLGGVDRLSRQAALSVEGKLVLGNGDQTVSTLAGTGRVDMQAYHLVVTNGGTFTGTLTSSGGSSLSTNGGSLSLSGTSAVQTQSLDLAGGSSLQLDAGSQLKTGAAVVQSGSTLHLTDGASFQYETLSGNGTIAAANFGNSAGAKVAGSLTFTGNLANQGTLAPGFSPGTVTILGNYVESGSLSLELAGPTPGTEHDQVRVGGTVTANPGSTLTFMPWNGAAPALGNVYQVIADANGGTKRVNGAFDDVLFDVDGADGAAAAAPSAAVVFDMATGRAIATGLNRAGSTVSELGRSKAQRAAAKALFDAATAGVGTNQIDTEQVLGSNAAAVLTTGDGLKKLVPEYYGAMADYGFSASESMSRMLVKRAAGEFGEVASQRGGFIVSAQTDRVHAADAKLRRNELVIGGDWALTPSIDIGGLVASSDGDIDGGYGSGSVKGQSVRVYAKARLSEKLSVLGGVNHGSYRYDLKRNAVSAEATGRTRGSGTGVNLGLAFEAYRTSEIAALPYVSLDYGSFRINGFEERGTSNHRLVLDSYRTTRTMATIGSVLEWKHVVQGRPMTLSADAALRGKLGDGNRTQRARLGVDSSVEFPMSYDSGSRTQALLGVAGSIRLSEAVTASAAFDSTLSSGRDDSLKVQLNVAF
ncbi:autotransporter-associated beta strand repeat-containing protein, partial [Aquincola sp. MAHUQ-54]